MPRRAIRSSGCALLATIPVLLGTPALGDEPLFGFIYTTDLLPKGRSEVEQWLTWRTQKAGGYYDQLENRTEFSYGVTSAFQLSGYLNYNWTEAYHNGPDGTTTPPEQFSANRFDPNGRFSATKFVGASLEAIYRVMSPYVDPIGLAFYFEPTFGGGDFNEFETRIILQKNFLDDRLVIAANLTWAPELRYIPGDPTQPPGSKLSHANTNVETDVNWSVGASYRFAPSWSLGWEFQNEREFDEWAIFAPSHAMGDAYYTGPTIHYGGKRFFITLTAWEQLPFAHNYSDPSVIVHGRDYDVDFEKYRVRLKLGYYF